MRVTEPQTAPSADSAGAVDVEERFPVSVARVLHNRPELADLRAWAVGAAGLAVGAA